MRTSSTYADWIGANLYNIAGDKVGTVGDIYCDDDTGEPEFVTVATDLIGTKTGIIPIAGSAPYEDGLRVPFTTDQINDAPTINTDDQLDKHDQQQLHAHYDLTNNTGDVTVTVPVEKQVEQVVREPTAGTTDHGVGRSITGANP